MMNKSNDLSTRPMICAGEAAGGLGGRRRLSRAATRPCTLSLPAQSTLPLRAAPAAPPPPPPRPPPPPPPPPHTHTPPPRALTRPCAPAAAGWARAAAPTRAPPSFQDAQGSENNQKVVEAGVGCPGTEQDAQEGSRATRGAGRGAWCQCSSGNGMVSSTSPHPRPPPPPPRPLHTHPPTHTGPLGRRTPLRTLRTAPSFALESPRPAIRSATESSPPAAVAAWQADGEAGDASQRVVQAGGGGGTLGHAAASGPAGGSKLYADVH